MRTRVLLLAVSVLFVPATAHAQFFGYGIFGSNPYTFGGRFYGYPGIYGMGGYGYGGYPGYGGYYGGYPYGGGYAGYGGYGNYYGNYGGYYGGYSTPAIYGTTSLVPSSVSSLYGQYIVPGWLAAGSNVSPRTRPTLNPAVEVAATEIKPAAYASGGPGSIATVEVKLPSAKAEIWFEGVKQGKTGDVREYTSPPLDPNSKYSYEIKIRWPNDAGSLQEMTRTVRVRAGERTVVDFTKKEK
jgi:uncharacterized protein (TIGR03000 family)